MTDESILVAFNNGEWCDTQDICRLLNITFAEGFRKFEFSRTVEWNKSPLNGQKITTKFRIKGSVDTPDEILEDFFEPMFPGAAFCAALDDDTLTEEAFADQFSEPMPPGTAPNVAPDLEASEESFDRYLESATYHYFS